ncbi:hypothetical protein DsansV1_C16g0141611 [Dioscorea sansibarensis]
MLIQLSLINAMESHDAKDKVEAILVLILFVVVVHFRLGIYFWSLI